METLILNLLILMISSQLSSPNYRGDLRIDYICNKVGAYDLYAKA